MMTGPILMIFLVLYLGGLSRGNRGYRNSWICIYLLGLLIVFHFGAVNGLGSIFRVWAVTLSWAVTR